MYKPRIELKYEDISSIFSEYDVVFKEIVGYGRVDPGEKEIILREGLNEKDKRITLMHEILHVFYDDINELDICDEEFIENEAEYYIEHKKDLVDFIISFL
tara:strand:- start:3232 stop:3534 length:303 start_codon:yes stop_codon:yes gene_type:complete